MITNVKLVYGIGFNDADYKLSLYERVGNRYKRLWVCPFYKKWQLMLMRCYSEKYKAKGTSYIECLVCEDWLRFSNFKAWMEDQDWEGKELDKDLLVRGNKIYSPETCVFISHKINNFIIEASTIRGKYPIGVHKNPGRAGFIAVCCSIETGKQIRLGCYPSPELAHEAWRSFKLEQAKVLASTETDPRIAAALIDRYENYQEV